jgi:hypothetical protein
MSQGKVRGGRKRKRVEETDDFILFQIEFYKFIL